MGCWVICHNIFLIFENLFYLILDAQSKTSKHAIGFVAHCNSISPLRTLSWGPEVWREWQKQKHQWSGVCWWVWEWSRKGHEVVTVSPPHGPHPEVHTRAEVERVSQKDDGEGARKPWGHMPRQVGSPEWRTSGQEWSQSELRIKDLGGNIMRQCYGWFPRVTGGNNVWASQQCKVGTKRGVHNEMSRQGCTRSHAASWWKKWCPIPYQLKNHSRWTSSVLASTYNLHPVRCSLVETVGLELTGDRMVCSIQGGRKPSGRKPGGARLERHRAGKVVRPEPWRLESKVRRTR